MNKTMNIALKTYTPNISTTQEIPLFLNPVSAGFPSVADDYAEKKLDLNKYLIKHPSATIFVRLACDVPELKLFA